MHQRQRSGPWLEEQAQESICANSFKWRPAALFFVVLLLMGMAGLGLGGQAVLAQGPAEVGAQAVQGLEVHYGHNYVSGSAPVGATVMVTVTDEIGSPVDTATVTADNDSRFGVDCGDWDSGHCPDIIPGYAVYASSGADTAAIDPIGAIIQDGITDAMDLLGGRIEVDWLGVDPVTVMCEVWEESGPPPVVTIANPSGGTFTCDFSTVGWDLQRGQHVAIRYLEPSGHSVLTSAVWPTIRVNVGHDWVSADFPAGHDMSVEVRTKHGDFKASANVSSIYDGGWGHDGFQTDGPDWSPHVPDIVPGDRVSVASSMGYTHTLDVGEIMASVDAASNTVTGHVYAPFDEPLQVECHPWGAWSVGIDAPVKAAVVQPDGADEFVCAWDPDTEWDVQPGQEIGVMYLEPEGHTVIDVFAEPAPHLRIDKRSHSDPAEGGNLRYEIEVWNDGSAVAQNVTITDTMQGLLYLTDTSGVMPTGGGSGPIIWNLGDLEPEAIVRFDLFVQVTAPTGQNVVNSVVVSTSTPGDQGEPWEKTATSESQVQANNTHLGAGLWAAVHDPAAGETFVLAGNVCNNGSTASSDVVLTAQLVPPLTLVQWWAYDAGWQEVASSPGELVVSLPSVGNWECRDVYMRAVVDDTAQAGDPVTATVSIASDSDLSPDDNDAEWHGHVGAPRVNLFVSKRFDGGQLVPGGEIRYLVEYGNSGNTAVGPVLITDTLPLNATYVGAWRHTPSGPEPFAPIAVEDGCVVWEVDALEGGSHTNLELIVAASPDASPGDMLLNTVEISPLPGEETHEDNVAEWSEVLYESGPNLRITKQAWWHDDARIEYSIQFFNVGTAAVAEVQIIDTLPDGVTFDGDWRLEFDHQRLVDFDADAGALTWVLSDLYPGDTGRLYFDLDVDEPGLPGQWYTNTVEITLPPGDPSPDDNADTAVSFSGGELRRVELWLNQRDPSSIWGEAQAGSQITVTTPITQVYAWADPDCGGCWNIENAGMIEPGDIITVTAGAGQMPVELTVRDPFDVTADSTSNEVWGEIGGLEDHLIEIHGQWPDGVQQTYTDRSGTFQVSYDDVPRAAFGFVRYGDMVDYTEVVWHRPFEATALILQINYADDWINSPYEIGHTGWFTVTESDGVTIKATAEMQSQSIPWWGGDSGFDSTMGVPWTPGVPDIQPGDWVFGQVENGPSAAVQVGEISAERDLANSTVTGTISPLGVGDATSLNGWCSVWAEDGPHVGFVFDVDDGVFMCDLGAAGWNLRLGQVVAIAYAVPGGDEIINVIGGERVYYLHLPMALGGSGRPDR